MRQSFDRRTALKLSMATVGAAMLLPGTALADDEFPPVPGMKGDRRANEMWYQFDEVAFYHAAPEVWATYNAIHAHVGGDNFVDGFRDRWLDLSAKPDYPHNYTEFVTPIREELQFLSTLQLTSFDKYYLPNSPRFIEAFGFFGQGVLFDPRRAEIQQEVHTMAPITAYHGWHSYLRAMMFLDIDRARWARIDPVIAFAWAVQAVANPSTHLPNPGLPDSTVRRLAASWLPRSSERLDHDFRSMPNPTD